MNTQSTFARCFPEQAVRAFDSAYPNDHRALKHALDHHPLLELDALADLAESLPASAVEYNKGALPIGIRAEDVPENGLSIGKTIRQIDTVASWAVLKHIERHPDYAALLHTLLDELKPTIEAVTGPMMRAEGYIFVSSPDAVTPFHFDPEHNILIQLRGKKHFHVFPGGDPVFAAHHERERYHAGGHRNIPWQDDFENRGEVVTLEPGDAIYVPVMAPHFVKNGDAPSISLSITWRSKWSMDEANAYAFNSRLRRFGLSPRPPSRFPNANRIRSTAERILRRFAKKRSA